jgi:hypothetical protein
LNCPDQRETHVRSSTTAIPEFHNANCGSLWISY